MKEDRRLKRGESNLKRREDLKEKRRLEREEET